MFHHTNHNAASKESGPVLIPPYLIIPNYVISSPLLFMRSSNCEAKGIPIRERGKKYPQNPTNKQTNKTNPNTSFSVSQFSISLINGPIHSAAVHELDQV